jgi:large subunit ribosomal protein LP1
VLARRDSRRTQITIPPTDVASVPQSGTEADSQAQNLHIRMRAHRSKSESHKKILRSRSTSPSAAGSATSSSTIPAKVPPVPQRRPAQAKKRSTSPDIADIISSTPRPRTRTSSYYSNGSSRDSQSLSRSGSMRRYPSEIQGAGPRSSTFSRSASEGMGSRIQSPAEANRESWIDDSFEDYGTPINRQDGFVATPPEPEAHLDRDGSDSDSSLDLHTPLP